MNIEFIDNEKENNIENTKVEAKSELKELLVNYVGEKQNPENGEVTVEMLVETVSEEFPDFVLAVAEENYVRGYHQALTDVEVGEAMYKEELQKRENDS